MPAQLSKNTKLLSISSFLGDISSEMLYPLLPIFLTQMLLAPAYAIGLMESLAEAALSISGFFAGARSDQTGKKKGLVLSGYFLSAAAKASLIAVVAWPQVLAIRVIDRAGKGVRETPRDALIVRSEDPSVVGRAFGFRKMLDNTGAIIGPLLATFLLTIFYSDVHSLESYKSIFMIAFVPAILAAAIIFFVTDKQSKPQHLNLLLKDVIRTNGTLPFLLISSLFALGQFSIMLFLLRAGEYLPVILLPVVYLAYNVLYTISSLPAGILADRIGSRNTLLAGVSFFLLALVICGVFPSSSSMFLVFGLLGIFMAVNKTAPQILLSKLVHPRAYATALGSYKGVLGLIALPANLIAAVFWTTTFHGVPVPFVFSIATTSLAIILLLVIVKE